MSGASAGTALLSPRPIANGVVPPTTTPAAAAATVPPTPNAVTFIRALGSPRPYAPAPAPASTANRTMNHAVAASAAGSTAGAAASSQPHHRRNPSNSSASLPAAFHFNVATPHGHSTPLTAIGDNATTAPTAVAATAATAASTAATAEPDFKIAVSVSVDSPAAGDAATRIPLIPPPPPPDAATPLPTFARTHSLPASIAGSGAVAATPRTRFRVAVSEALSGRAVLQFGSRGSGNRTFLGAFAVAVDRRRDIIYCSEYKHHRIRVVQGSTNATIAVWDGTGAVLPIPPPLETPRNVRSAVPPTPAAAAVPTPATRAIANGSIVVDRNMSIRYPAGLAIDRLNDRLFVADSGHSRIVCVRASDGAPLTCFGTRGTTHDSHFLVPSGLVLDDTNGWLYVSDRDRHQITVWNTRVSAVSAVNATLPKMARPQFLRRLSGTGSVGTGGGEYHHPCSLALDEYADRLLIADLGNRRVAVVSTVTGAFIDQIAAAVPLPPPTPAPVIASPAITATPPKPVAATASVTATPSPPPDTASRVRRASTPDANGSAAATAAASAGSTSSAAVTTATAAAAASSPQPHRALDIRARPHGSSGSLARRGSTPSALAVPAATDSAPSHPSASHALLSPPGLDTTHHSPVAPALVIATPSTPAPAIRLVHSQSSGGRTASGGVSPRFSTAATPRPAATVPPTPAAGGVGASFLSPTAALSSTAGGTFHDGLGVFVDREGHVFVAGRNGIQVFVFS